MAIGMNISARMSQNMTLAPQLQASLALLQAPTLELAAMLQNEIQQNPMLEEVPSTEVEVADKPGREDEATTQLDPAEPPRDVLYDPATEKPSNAPVDDFMAEWQKLVQFDTEWREYYAQTNVPNRASEEDEERRQFMFDSLASGVSLQENLLEQVRLSDMDEGQTRIAELIVGNIDEYGYLKSSIEELALNHQHPVEQVGEVLKLIQTFQPPGVGARDLRECLLLQLDRAGRKETLEYQIVDQYMEALGKRRLPEMAKGLDRSVDEIQDAVQEISRLEPRPGRAFLPDNDQYVVPEVFVTKSGTEYVVSTNNEQVPQLRISNYYKDLMSKAESSPEVRDYIREKIRAGKFLIKSIHQRQQTITNIAKEIVSRQREFMQHGVSALRPMTMVQVAEAVGVHETTVSRAVSGKYMQTPQGIFEMKYFFTSGIQTASGGTMSNTSVKDIIAEIFAAENHAKPLSDQEVVKMLAERNIIIARRTVAKYRDELNILPSNLRKVY
ncbi:MAG TPA: RNA polymerase sigma-54 factor [Verrucomicrobiales bacterium]|nr:RNA polymerase sigma-54 factor [Verrucomicrobiales bacterium]